MLTIKKYIFGKVIFFCSYLTLLFSTILWLIQVVRYCKVLFSHQTPFLHFLKLTLLLIPSILTYVIPFTFCLGCIYIYKHLDDTNELTILPMLGVPSIHQPILLTGLFFVFIQTTLQILSPITFNEFLTKEYNIKKQLTFKIFKPRQFNYHKNYTIFFDHIENNVIHNIFISHQKKSASTFITAQKAHLVLDDKKGYIINLEKGMRIEDSPKQKFSLSFNHLEYTLGQWMPKLSQNLTLSMNFKELIQENTTITKHELVLRIIKILLPLLSILILIVCLLNIKTKHKFLFATVTSVSVNAILIIISKWITALF